MAHSHAFLLISASSTIGMKVTHILSQNPNNKLILHARPKSIHRLQYTQDNIIIAPPLDLVDPRYTDTTGEYYGTIAAKKWMQHVITQYNPSTIIIATGGGNHSITEICQINAAIPTQLSELFITMHRKSGFVPRIIFMNSAASDWRRYTIFNSPYFHAKYLMTDMLKTFNKAYKKCVIVNIKIGPIDTKLYRNNVAPKLSWTDKYWTCFMIDAKSAAKSICNYIDLTSARQNGYYEFYAPVIYKYYRYVLAFAFAIVRIGAIVCAFLLIMKHIMPNFMYDICLYYSPHVALVCMPLAILSYGTSLYDLWS